MELTRRNVVVYGLLAAVWVLVVAWQSGEHSRFCEAARTDLRNRSKDIANTVSACIRGMRFRGTVLQERLEPVLQELVEGRSNELVKASELISIALLNAAGQPVASAGHPIDFAHTDILQQGERWGWQTVTFVNPVDLGASVLPPMHEMTNTFRGEGRTTSRRGPEGEGFEPGHPPGADAPERPAFNPPPPPRGERDGRPRTGEGRFRRPPWLRGMSEQEYESLMKTRALHGLAITMSTKPLRFAAMRDLWLRGVIVLLATVSVVGSGLAWRNLAKTSELQIRLVRASELNTHLKEMNLAAAGLAHETRNPLNIIRGLAQMISKQPDISAEIRQKSREIIDEADKVAAQLNEFINYSRPREVRRGMVALSSTVNEVVRALSYDLEEKRIQLERSGEALNIEADEQLLRQALFNLLLNAIQAVGPGGVIEVAAQRQGADEAVLEVRDNGPGVPPERRAEIFKPYFTTQTRGTGLGLAVVQQIVLAHGWEIECLANEPKGARFRLTHLKLLH